ncbi:tRNA pseudouridine(55) synthase TruB [Portibacter lacus]|uniref:tRNA pseudouridine synthase B n=1 Tax=Portibacter lacus TaxID=1099794 RepID=A0AA37STQ2_9BACT|nr:tRNA pseudouridine(55) synthase TruB [Portibacter lacus]GLR20062.1 tRNA pseudouridine synthase B [Portibacter lacus]
MIPFVKDINETDFQEGALLLVDKPLEWTSFDVVNKIRYTLKHRLGVKKIKVGHAGTLDPLATGLLLICTGKFTKKINDLTDLNKQYEGKLKLGATTLSYDAEMEENETFDIEAITEEQILNTVENFKGAIQQFPPIYSAVKIDGVASYKRARQGEDVKTRERTVNIEEFVINKVEKPYVEFSVTCSKGTYIRTLADDFGKSLNNGAYLVGLKRTKTAGYDVKDAWDLDTLINELRDVH